MQLRPLDKRQYRRRPIHQAGEWLTVEVNGTDTVDSTLWLEMEDIIVCDGKLFNTDDKTSVEARRIK
jgi:hypothetical protein